MKDNAAGVVLDALADAVAERVVERLMAGTIADHVDQATSPLGPRRHCAIVRRRMAAGEPGMTRDTKKMMTETPARTRSAKASLLTT